MEKSRSYLEIKVGLFVLIGIVLLGTLLLQFSKGTSAFRGTYALKLTAVNVGGLKPRAGVLLAGVQVGIVDDIQLAHDGKSVTILLQIYKDYPIYSDARFVIESAGFLGDQFVSVIPTDNALPPLTNNAVVACQEPFDLQEVARGAAGFIKRMDVTAQKLDASVTDLRQQVLNAQTLSGLGGAITNLKAITDEALVTVHNINGLVVTNGSKAGIAVSNLVAFSSQLTQLGVSAQGILASNSVNIDAATRNIDDTTATLKQLAADMQAGKGLAGAILQNQELATNVMDIAANLSITTSNLNRRGLWGIMWSRKPTTTSTTNSDTYTSGLKRK